MCLFHFSTCFGQHSAHHQENQLYQYIIWYVEYVWNVMAHAQKPDFVFRRNGRVHLNRRGRQFSPLLAAEVCASAVVMLDTPRFEVVWEYWLLTPFASFPFTSPPVRHRVPSGFKRTLLLFVGDWVCRSGCVSIFSTTIVWTFFFFHFKKNWKGYCQKCAYVFMLSNRSSCQISMKLEFSRRISLIEKAQNIKFYENTSSGSRVVPCAWTDRRTDMTWANSRFSQSCECA